MPLKRSLSLGRNKDKQVIILHKSSTDDSYQSILKEISPGCSWKEWCWSWNSSTLATSYEELTHWKKLWCQDGLGAGEGDDRGWDGWMASLTRWTWDWVNSGSWWWTGRPGMLRFKGSQRVGHDWATELNLTEDSVKVVSSVTAMNSNKHGFALLTGCLGVLVEFIFVYGVR